MDGELREAKVDGEEGLPGEVGPTTLSTTPPSGVSAAETHHTLRNHVPSYPVSVNVHSAKPWDMSLKSVTRRRGRRALTWRNQSQSRRRRRTRRVRTGSTPHAGSLDFSWVRQQANLVTVTYLKDERNVSRTSALSFYQLVSTKNTTDSVKGKLRKLACTLERKEKGGKLLWIDAVTDPGATASLLSWNNAKELQSNVREAVDVCISTAKGASLDLRGQTDIWLKTHSGKKLIHCYVVGDLAQELLVCTDDYG